jgi:hypothetical protein
VSRTLTDTRQRRRLLLRADLRQPEVQQRRGQTGLSNPIGHALRVGLSLIEAIQGGIARCVGTSILEACLFHSAHPTDGLFCSIEPTNEYGMHDYRLDAGAPSDAVRRLTDQPRRTVSNHAEGNCPPQD